VRDKPNIFSENEKVDLGYNQDQYNKQYNNRLRYSVYTNYFKYGQNGAKKLEQNIPIAG